MRLRLTTLTTLTCYGLSGQHGAAAHRVLPAASYPLLHCQHYRSSLLRPLPPHLAASSWPLAATTAVPRVRPPSCCASSASAAASETNSILSINPALDHTLPFRVLAFYAIAPIADPTARVEAHRAFLSAREMVGRVYICAEGLNAQVSGSTAACAEYRDFVSRGDDFADADTLATQPLLFKEDPVGDLQFPKLRVKHKALVPGAPVDLAQRGEDLSPERWAAMLAAADEKRVVLDVRNSYEWDVGRFDGAERPALDHFAEFDAATYGLPDDPDERKATPVMMYCTGGIRCEYFSAKLKEEGFENVYKLQGGVQHYGNVMSVQGEQQQEEEAEAAGSAGSIGSADASAPAAAADSASAAAKGGNESDSHEAEGAAAATTGDGSATPHWRGSLFVFDRRNTLRFGAQQEAQPPIGHCRHCSTPSESFINCVRSPSARLLSPVAPPLRAPPFPLHRTSALFCLLPSSLRPSVLLAPPYF